MKDWQCLEAVNINKKQGRGVYREETSRPSVVQTERILGNIQGIPAEQAFGQNLKENLHRECLDVGKHFPKNHHAHQQARHRKTVSADPIEIFLRLRFTHE
jgi:hypothetical protein